MEIILAQKKLRLSKMRKQLYRNVSDVATGEFHVYDDSYEEKTQEFVREFGKKMQLKHGQRFLSINAEIIEDFTNVYAKRKIRLTAQLKEK